MTKDEEYSCSAFAINLAKVCLYMTDNNAGFYEHLGFLSREEQNRLLREIIYFRCSAVHLKITKEIRDADKKDMIAFIFRDKIRDDLRLPNGEILENKIRYYAQDNAENEYMSDRITKNAHLSKESESDLFFKFPLYADNFTKFDMTIEKMFEYFLADPETKRRIIESDKGFQQYQRTKEQNRTGCFVIIAIVALIIYFIMS